MRTLGNQHYLGEKDCPAHWSGPAARYLEQEIKLRADLAVAINRLRDDDPVEAKFRTILAVMHSELVRVQRMVSEGVIRGMVKDEFWKQYQQVPINVEAAVKITNRLVDELGHYELRALVNDAVSPRVEERQVA